jgi:hypothetical protein
MFRSAFFSCSGVNIEFLPIVGSAVLPLKIPSCKVLESILNDVASARNVQPFRVALMAVCSVSFVHAAVYVTLFFYSGLAAKTLSSVAMEISMALYLANVGSSTGKRWILADI